MTFNEQKRGLAGPASDSFHITLHGRSGHGSQPQRTIDPIVVAASTILKLQTIVSREIAAQVPAVVTCGMVKAGDAENIIPEFAELKLNIRTWDSKTRDTVIAAICRIVNAESEASGAIKPPTIQQLNSFPVMSNDEEVTKKLEETFAAHFGRDKHHYAGEPEKTGGSEDFPFLATSVDRPYSMFPYGGIDPAVWDKAEKAGRLDEDVPGNHSSFFAPVVMPTLQRGTDGYAAAALTWLAK